jgi:pimeloyl-ACP methyl ester carboxylesterase
MARHARPVLLRLVDSRPGRALVLGQTHGRPTRLSVEYARSTIHSLDASPGFDAVLRATATRHVEGFSELDLPLTVAFGSRDRLLLPGQSRRLDQLPPNVRLDRLPGCGHVPIADDPDAVAALILRSATHSTEPHPDGDPRCSPGLESKPT